MNKNKKILAISVISLCVALLVVLGALILPLFSGSKQPVEPTAAPISFSDIAVGDRITLGHYEQDGDIENGGEAIEWRVLSVEDGRALVISERILDHMKYNEIKERVSWETSDLRNWLNGEFYDMAFSPEEKEMILTATLDQPENPVAGTLGGNITEDKVFCLSYNEADGYFASDEERVASSTVYAQSHGAWEGPCWWWLRTPGDNSWDTEFVFDHGEICLFGSYAYADKISVRPALYISL